jgi:DNA-binding transcriptional regulator YiaG
LYRWLKKNISREEPKAKSHLSLKKNFSPNYKVIFEDLAKERYKDLVPKYIQQRIESLNNHLDVLELNKLIFNQNYSSKETAQMKAYDRASIEKVLQTQVKDNLSNREIATMFHLSRNTVAKWKKEYNSINN